jgi:hypothetical protein
MLDLCLLLLLLWISDQLGLDKCSSGGGEIIIKRLFYTIK